MKIEVNMDSTSLGSSSCVRKYKNITIGELIDGVPDGLGGYRDTFGASAAYGICVHKYNDIMYKTNGYLPEARRVSLELFRNIRCTPDSKKPWLRDEKHFQIVMYKLWEEYIKPETSFGVLQVPTQCYWCKGTGQNTNPASQGLLTTCVKCEGKGIVEGAANELTFSIKLFEDEFLVVNLKGTIDQEGKFNNGCFAIRDWKTTSYWNETEYLDAYELSRQLRLYRLATKLEARHHPDSLLGRIGSTRMGCFIDGIFLKPKADDTVFKRGQVFYFSDEEILAFEQMLIDYCKKLSLHIRSNYWPKEGILNGTCQGRFGNCAFWNVCAKSDEVGRVLLRKMERKHYDPLNWDN